MGFASQQGIEFTLIHLTAKGGYAVDKHAPFEVVELMLHNASQITLGPFVMFLELLIHVAEVYLCGARHLLVDARQTEAALLENLLLPLRFQNMGIDIRNAP